MKYLLLICLSLRINYTEYPWNNFDELTFERAKTRCAFYFKNSPCLKELRKLDKQRYQAICGVKE